LKVKDFLKTIDNNIHDRIDTFSNALKGKIDFKSYRDFEDVLVGESEFIIYQNIKPEIKPLPNRFSKGATK
jgi:hypothetical protein